jgi:hypothetical protein
MFRWLSGVAERLKKLISRPHISVAPRTVRHMLMRREIDTRISAASVLENGHDDSDAAYLLRLLAFELLLKLAVEVRTSIRAPKHHHFHRIFRLLPKPAQDHVLRLSGERIGPSALTTNHTSVLKDLGRNFINLRYPYEKYSHLTDTQYRERGAKWLASGAPIRGADFRYHPVELLGLTAALQQLTAGCELTP